MTCGSWSYLCELLISKASYGFPKSVYSPSTKFSFCGLKKRNRQTPSFWRLWRFFVGFMGKSPATNWLNQSTRPIHSTLFWMWKWFVFKRIFIQYFIVWNSLLSAFRSFQRCSSARLLVCSLILAVFISGFLHFNHCRHQLLIQIILL